MTAFPADVLNALADDLNTPKALRGNALARGETFSVPTTRPRYASIVPACSPAAGCSASSRERRWPTFKGEANVDVALVERLVAARTAARAERDFARADTIRAELAELASRLEDSRQGHAVEAV